MATNHVPLAQPSDWVRRWAPRVASGAAVLDVAWAIPWMRLTAMRLPSRCSPGCLA
jgi:hypothetical protein